MNSKPYVRRSNFLNAITNAAQSPNLPEENELSDNLQIIPYSFESAADLCKPFEPFKADQRWKKIANELLQGLDSEQWDKRRKNLGTDTTEGIAQFNARILGASGEAFQQAATQRHGAGVMILAKAYAINTAAVKQYADTCRKLHNFMELVLVSLCAVLEILGYPVDKINEAMRICLSHSEDENLSRLRQGALWVNGTIMDIYTAGAGRKGNEFFLLYGVSMSKYSILARIADSRTRFTQRLSKKIPKYSEDSTRKETSIFPNFFIPGYIKSLVGDQIELSDICDALGYDDGYITNSALTICERHSSLASESSRSRKRKRPPKNGESKRRRKQPVVEEVIDSQPEQIQPTPNCHSGGPRVFAAAGNNLNSVDYNLPDRGSHITPPTPPAADSRCSSSEVEGRGLNLNDGRRLIGSSRTSCSSVQKSPPSITSIEQNNPMPDGIQLILNAFAMEPQFLGSSNCQLSQQALSLKDQIYSQSLPSEGIAYSGLPDEALPATLIFTSEQSNSGQSEILDMERPNNGFLENAFSFINAMPNYISYSEQETMVLGEQWPIPEAFVESRSWLETMAQDEQWPIPEAFVESRSWLETMAQDEQWPIPEAFVESRSWLETDGPR